jgi:peptidoglycan/LPS O-acetylase OafA/YrhL
MIENKENLDYIDALRGVAILMVIMVHVVINTSGAGNNLILFGSYGQMGVQLFFLISAVTLCLSLKRNIYNKGWLKSFYIKRYFRIAPLYYIGIVLYYCYYYCLYLSIKKPVFAALSSNYSIKNIFANVFFVHGFYEPANNTIVAGGWSIGTEMAFYVVFPIIFIGIRKVFDLFKERWWLILATYLLIVLVDIFAVYKAGQIFNLRLENDTFLYYNLLNQLPVFLTGIFLYFTMQYFNFKINNYISVMLLILTTGASIICFSFFNNITIVPLISGISFVFLFFVFKDTRSLNTKLLRRIGQMSFSIYIFHFVFAETISKAVSKHVFKGSYAFCSFLVAYGVTVLFSIAVAMLSERFMERKGIKLGKKLSARYA